MQRIEKDTKAFDLMDGTARVTTTGEVFFDAGCCEYRAKVVDQDGCEYAPLVNNLQFADTPDLIKEWHAH